MLSNQVPNLLSVWEKQGRQQQQMTSLQITVSYDDRAKVSALGEVYHLSEAQLLSSILHTGLKEIEQGMPYKAGNKVIREEEGEPIYEDIGPTPAYLQAKQRIQQEMQLSAVS